MRTIFVVLFRVLQVTRLYYKANMVHSGERIRSVDTNHNAHDHNDKGNDNDNESSSDYENDRNSKNKIN